MKDAALRAHYILDEASEEFARDLVAGLRRQTEADRMQIFL